MRIYYDNSGQVLYTIMGDDVGPESPHIVLPDQDLGELADWRVIDGQLVRAVPLATAQDRARHEINRVRGEVRLLFITALPGQEMVYLDKEAQARAYLSDPDPDPADYPGIMAEVGATAPTAYEVAQVYLNQAAIWRQVSAVIEGVAMAAHATIDTAASAEVCETVAAGFEGDLRAALTAAGALP